MRPDQLIKDPIGALLGLTGGGSGGGGGGGGTSGGGKFYECVEVGDGTWSGREWVLVEGVYTKAESVTSGLAWTSVKPVVGKSYSADALIQADYFFTDAPYKPLTLTAEEAGSTVAIAIEKGSPTVSGLQYRVGTSGAWLPYSIDTVIPLANVGDCVQFQNTENALNTLDNYAKFSLTGKIAGSGSIMSMLNYSDACVEYCFGCLFINNNALTTPPEFPAMKLALRCYYSTFEDCTALTVAPALPAMELAPGCYRSMFYRTAITSIVLLATKLVDDCYAFMLNQLPSMVRIEVGFTEWHSNATDGWVNGVASDGIFVCPSDLPEYQDGNSRMPYNWTIVRR
jgi:hypothetical protein